MKHTHHSRRDNRLLMLGMLFAGAAALVMASAPASADHNHGAKQGKAKQGKAKRGKAKRGKRMKRLNRMFNRFDVNKDGLLSRAELAET